MSDDFHWNDTLDNILFSNTQLLIPSQSIVKEIEVNAATASTITNNSSTSTSATINKSDKESVIPQNEISFDDSFFVDQSQALLRQCSILEKEQNEKMSSNKMNEKENINPKNDSFDIISSSEDFTNKLIIEESPVTKIHEVSPEPHQNSLEEVATNLEITDETCKLSFWGLPDAVLEKYESKNIKQMFYWQAECLAKIIHKNKNLVYSAPTSAGKTLVAEILALKSIFELKKKVIFILPFVSIVREKMYYFQDILNSSGVRVDGFMGSHNPPGGFQSVQFAICTIEKANSLINRLLEEGKLSEVGAILVDEMHLLGDPSRGYLLELLLTKLRYISLKDSDVNIQIIGMSATLPNLTSLAKWLDAELYTTDFRPIPLKEQVIENGNIYDCNLEPIRKLETISDIGKDTDNILQLCLETIKDSCSVLIFCPTKNWCESLAEQVALAFFKIGNTDSIYGQLLRDQIKGELILEVLEQLKYCPVGLDDILRKTVAFGVAFHHAGLTMDERDIIEGAFRNGAIRILIATSTLSSGVNLPARRVIIRTPNFHGRPIDILTYRQMIGRAGRMGKDTMGESFLVCHKNDFLTAKNLVSGNLRAVESCLEGEGKLKRAILEIIASGVASTPDDVNLFTKCTLLAASEDIADGNIENPIEEAISFLKTNEFIRLQKSDEGCEKYVATSLGKACLTSSMPPDEGLSLFSELDRARQCFVLETELHLIYLVTPYNACNSWGNLDWMLYLDFWEKLSAPMKKVGELVGIKQSFLINAARGKIQTNTTKSYHQLMVHKRFFVALALQDLVNERSLSEVSAKFNCNRGLLQSLQQSASSFAGMVTSFSRELGWHNIEILFSQFQDRMQFGVSRDLLDLMRLPLLNGKMARILYNSGIENLILLANSNVPTIENIFHKSVPFESSKERDGESEYSQKQRNKFRRFWITGKDGLTEREAAEMLVSSARDYLKLEIGLADAKWNSMTQNIEDGSDSITKQVENLDINKSESEKSVEEEEAKNKNEKIETEQVLLTTSGEFNVSHCSDISSVSFTKIEENVSSVSPGVNMSSNNTQGIENNTKQPENEIDLSDNSIFKGNFSLNSDKSLFDESLHLQLSLSEETENKDNDELASDQSLFDSGTFLEKAFCSSFECDEQKSLKTSNTSSNENETFRTPSTTRKRNLRNRISLTPDDTPTKKKKIIIEKIKSPQVHEENGVSKMNIINVCFDENLLSMFEKDIKEEKYISLSLACSKVDQNIPKIGANLIQTRSKSPAAIQEKFIKDELKVDGVAIACSDSNIYYLGLNNEILNKKTIQILSDILNNPLITIAIFDSKEQIRILKDVCDIETRANIEDPKVADWLLNPDSKETNLINMVTTYCSKYSKLSTIYGNCQGNGSIGISLTSFIDSKIRASVEALSTLHLMKSLKNVLKENDQQLINIFEIEMQTVRCLAHMEVLGMAVNKFSLKKLVDQLKFLMESIETKTYSLAGRQFNFMSARDVSIAIGRLQRRKAKANKQVLKESDHPISDLVLLWRKLSCTCTKMLHPIIWKIKNDRIHGRYDTRTSTGRITMHEPNLQNMAKDFVVKDPLDHEEVLISCRGVFSVPSDYILVSADYCQLELRILAHLANEKLLKSILCKPGDVFKSIAAKWNNIDENDVTDEMRQNTKQICYGIIYGMGEKSLAEQLGKSEEEVVIFMETFRNTYPNINTFIKDQIKFCCDNGFIKTISGRKRYLPHIQDRNPATKAQAERQAVNTCVQGTAADISKKAMISIEAKLLEVFKKSRHKPHICMHLHDELICETPKKYLNKVALIMRKCMENATKLSVPLPVKVKTGRSWGKMTEYDL